MIYLGHYIIMSLYYYVIILLCHNIIMSLYYCHYIIMS